MVDWPAWPYFYWKLVLLMKRKDCSSPHMIQIEFALLQVLTMVWLVGAWQICTFGKGQATAVILMKQCDRQNSCSNLHKLPAKAPSGQQMAKPSLDSGMARVESGCFYCTCIWSCMSPSIWT